MLSSIRPPLLKSPNFIPAFATGVGVVLGAPAELNCISQGPEPRQFLLPADADGSSGLDQPDLRQKKGRLLEAEADDGKTSAITRKRLQRTTAARLRRPAAVGLA
jgi:hypothetical protein